MHCVATAIKLSGKDAVLHLRLGVLLEEQFFLEKMIGFKPSKVLHRPLPLHFQLNPCLLISHRISHFRLICVLYIIGEALLEDFG